MKQFHNWIILPELGRAERIHVNDFERVDLNYFINRCNNHGNLFFSI